MSPPRSRLALTDAVIVDAVRTPVAPAAHGEAFARVPAVELLAAPLAALLTRTGIDAALVDDIIAGYVTRAGEHGAHAVRRAALRAGYPPRVPAVAVDRGSGSSQQALHFAAQAVMSGSCEVVIAAGLGQSSQVRPDRDARTARLAADADRLATRWRLSRVDLDHWAMESHRRAAAARSDAAYGDDIVTVHSTEGPCVERDVLRARPSWADLRAAAPIAGGASTLANTAPPADGAAAAIVMTAERASQLGIRPRALVHTMVVEGVAPDAGLSPSGPATRTVLTRSGLRLDDIDVVEVHEPSAAALLAWARELGADPGRINVHGGALAWGDPAGAAGARMTATLLGALDARDARYGLQVISTADGLANALILERLVG